MVAVVMFIGHKIQELSCVQNIGTMNYKIPARYERFPCTQAAADSKNEDLRSVARGIPAFC